MLTRRRTHPLTYVGLALVVSAFESGSSSPGSPVLWRSGPVETARRSPPEIRKAITALVSDDAVRHVVVQFDDPVGSAQRALLESGGLRLLACLGNNAFFASLSKSSVDPITLTRAHSIVDIRPPEPEWKLHATLASGGIPPWAIVSRADDDVQALPGDSVVVGVYVLFHPDVLLDPDGMNVAMRHEAVIRSTIHSVNGLVVELPVSRIRGLVEEDAVQWIEPPLPTMDGVNNSVRESTQANVVQAAPYGLDGSGVNVLVYDAASAAADHPDFGGRLSVNDGTFVEDHPTHVSCTIGGNGAASGGLYRGMAPNVSLQSYGFQYDGSGVFLYTNPGDIESDYDEAINVHGAHLANNSIGTNACKNAFDCEITGDYGVTAQLIDAIVTGSLGTPFRVVWANGNERSCGRCRDEDVHTPQGYHSTAPPACAKNHITVGALNSNDDSVTSFTSWGPTDDGRLKPDISAPGCQQGADDGVTSCRADGGYESNCGTSMAAPTVTGLVALLLQDFRAQFPGSPDPLNSTIKALLAHNAFDLEEAGPDFKTGYGAVRIRETIDFMRSGSFLEGQLQQGGEFMTFAFNAVGSGPVKITLAWDDVPGTPNVATALVDDLDLQVYDPSFNRYYPWTLDPDNPSAPAVQTRPDHINNIEQVYVNLPGAGIWTIRVVGFNVPVGPQRFSLCIEPQFLDDCNGNGVPDVDEIQVDPSLDCTGNGALDECERDCDGDGTADSCAIASGASTDCNADLAPDECGASSDCNDNGIYDPCDIVVGGLTDCNNNWIPDVCIELEEDCNANLAPDACDIANGSSADCDVNGKPDECQDTGTDCNGNGTWDACDIDRGTSEDFNGNGIPDDCEANRTHFVDVAACPSGGTGDATDPYCRIQDAIDASISGDLVQVADGTYAGDGQTNLNFRGRSITVRSESGPDNCILDGEWTYGRRGFIFANDETKDAVVDGLTIFRMYGDPGSGISFDGAGATIRNCRIQECATSASSGVIEARNNSKPTLVDCVLSDNYGTYTIRNDAGSHMTMHNCSLSDQRNGIFNSGELTAVNCSFRNHCDAVDGGGQSMLTNCSFSENVDAFGGSYSSTLIGCTFVANRNAFGGADLTVKGCTVASEPRRTFTANCFIPWLVEPYDEVSVGGTTLIENSIIRSGIFVADNTTLSVSYSNIGPVWEQGCESCTIELNDGVINVDPKFRFDENGDPRLAPNSPCIDAGNPAFEPSFRQKDIDGDPRVNHGIVDMGADEAGEFVDCNGTFRPGWQDIALGNSTDVNANGVPDECDARWPLYVDDNAPSDPGPGDPAVSDPLEDGSPVHPYDAIQEAIDVASHVVIVRDGRYSGFGNHELNFAGAKIVLRSENGPRQCVIDPGGDYRAFVFDHGETADTRVEGFTIVNGYEGRGGAILCIGSSPTIEGCLFAANAGWARGGAIQCEGSSPTILRCQFIGNHSLRSGGAIYAEGGSNLLIDGCTFAGNNGGALHLQDSSATLRNCTIVGNRGDDIEIPGAEFAAAVSCAGLTSTVVIQGSTLVNNHVLPGSAGVSGLLVESGCNLSAVNMILWGPSGSPNEAIRVEVGSAAFDYSDIVGGNPGGNVVWGPGNIDQDPLFPVRPAGSWTADGSYDPLTHHVTVTDTAASWAPDELAGLFLNPDTSRLFEYLIVANTTTQIEFYPHVGTLGLGYSVIEAGDAYEIHDYHLPFDSPCVNAGDPGYVPGGIEVDMDGEARVNQGRIDMGSDEAHDCNLNSVPDYQDLALLASADCDADGIPDECQAWQDCNGNGVFDPCEVRDGTAPDCDEDGILDGCALADGSVPDCNQNAIPDECDVASGAALDCNSNGIPDSCDLGDASSGDVNGNAVPDECDPDCQPNGIPDDWDLVLGTSADCNANAFPDECEWLDCNGNDTPDDCDINEGTSADCDESGRPDECELIGHDCNANAVLDHCDVGLGASLDCQANWVPDECELSGNDCNTNAVPDECDVESGTSLDCQGNGVPDECETDCDGNGVADDCETLGDDDGDGIVNCYDLCPCSVGVNCVCPAYDECCWFDGQYCVPDYPRDLCLEQSGTPQCGEIPCQDGCLTVFTDCNGNGIPDVRDVGCYEYCDPPCGESADCNANGVPDECDISAGTPDFDGNGIPDECEAVGDPSPALHPHDRRKNRYISFDPNKVENDGKDIAFQVELKSLTLGSCSGNGGFCRADRGGDDCKTCSVDGNPCINQPIDCAPAPPQTCDPSGETCVNDAPDSGGSNVGRVWWVGPESPLNNDVHLMVSEPFRKISADWPNPTHVGDCEIVPQAVYGVRAVNPSAGTTSAEVVVETTLYAPISASWWADCVGPLKRFCGGDIRMPQCTGDGDCSAPATCDLAWTVPDGAVNVDDITAVLGLVAPGPESVPPDMTWVDLYGNASGAPASQNFDPPDFVANVSDIGAIVFGFGGRPYTFNDPADCPDEGSWP